MFKTHLACLSFSLSCLTGASAMATQPSPGTAKLPQSYRLDDVSVHIARQPGRGVFPVRSVSLSGRGTATIEQDGKQRPFHFASKNMLALLNDLYKVRFFDLPTNYMARYSVILKDDGLIRTSQSRVLDASSTRVCFSVPTYEKCVTYGSEGHHDLEDITARVFAEAEKLVNTSQP
jgi:hypothetical protein